MPQVHVLLLIWKMSDEGCKSPVGGIDDPLFILTFVTSVTAASYGISKFIKTGPCRIIRNNTRCSGFGTLSYILLFLNIASTLSAKGYTIVAEGRGPTYFEPSVVTLLPGVFFCFMPQLAMVRADT